MFTTGAKLYFGLTAAALGAFVVYGVTQNFGALGTIGLIFLIAALAGLGTTTLFGRDSTVSAMDSAAIDTSAAGAASTPNSMWPLVAALGGVVLAVGVVTDKRFFIAGVVLVFAATLEWAVHAWSERTTGDASHNLAVRRRLAHPLELPLIATAGLGAAVFAFSRIMVGASKDVGPVVFMVAASVILMFGIIFARLRHIGRGVAVGVCAVGAVALLGTGVAMAARGERAELAEAQAADHFDSRSGARHCGEEATEADHKASGSVSMKSNVLADVYLEGSTLKLDQIGGFEGSGVLTVDRGNPVTVLFHNDSDAERRLRIYAGSDTQDVGGTAVTTDREFCTRLVGEGKVQALTFTMPKPSAGAAEPYYLEVPGVAGARIEIVVP